MDQHKNTVIIIAGPTASGKTALAIQLAEYYKTEIISADSRQCYKELNIGVAKPSVEELRRVKHHFIDSHSIHESVTAQTFEQYALNSVFEIFKNSSVAVMAGGTGLYIKAFCEGLDEIPPIDEAIKKNIIQQYNLMGLAWLQQQLKEKDPAFWSIAEQQNPHRLLRALEVLESTGKSITFFRKKKIVHRPFNIIKLGINIAKEELRRNIDRRVDEMMQYGLQDEVRYLLPYKDMAALQTVGYKEMFQFFENNVGLPEAINQIKSNTKKYAKRQITWFKNDENIKWLSDVELECITAHLSSILDN